jgi:hypothetical protein
VQFPVGVLEPTKREIVEYYEPKDLLIGATINVFGRRFLIFDMDECTKEYYRLNFGFTDFTPICIEAPKAPRKPLVNICFEFTKILKIWKYLLCIIFNAATTSMEWLGFSRRFSPILPEDCTKTTKI